MVLWAACPLTAGTPPAGFSETVLLPSGGAGGVSLATAAAYEPGSGHLWVVEQDGEIRRREAGTGTVTTALALPCVNSSGERGGLGIAFSPAFLDGPSTRWVYIYYTRTITASGQCAIGGTPAQARNQVSRFLESGGTLSGEEVLLSGPPLGATNHNGGAIRFAADGMLYIAMGDNDTDGAANPASRDLGDLRGSILRIAADGGIPADNPFVGQGGVRPEIWAWGLRNPFRFSIDPDTDTLFIADVGENTWEAVYVGEPGADYGYPCYEADQPFRTCNPQPTGVVDPVLVYGHGSETPPVSGNSITGGPVYRAGAFPLQFRDAYFFGDYVDGWIRSASVTADNELTNVQMFMPDATNVVDMIVSPSDCLTWVSRSVGVREVCFDAAGLDQDEDGFTPDDGDCNDTDDQVYPGAPEICDGADNDCNGPVDDALCGDYDADGDTRVDGVELAWIGRAFGLCSPTPAAEWWAGVDYDGNGCIDGDDLAFLGAAFSCEGAGPFCD